MAGSFPGLVRDIFKKWNSDNVSGMAAALAYYAVFSLIPLLVIFATVLSIVLGENGAQYEIRTQMVQVFGPQIGQLLGDITAATRYPHNAFAASLSVIVTVVGALSLFTQLKWSLDRIWQAPPREGKTFWQRALPDTGVFLMIVATGIILLAFSVASTAVSILAGHAYRHLLPLAFDLALADAAIFFLLSATLFAVVYKVMPNVELRFRDVRVGAIVTALLFTLGRVAISIYFHFKDVTSIYGAASAIILLLLWAYYSAHVFYIGAEFTYLRSKSKH